MRVQLIVTIIVQNLGLVCFALIVVFFYTCSNNSNSSQDILFSTFDEIYNASGIDGCIQSDKCLQCLQKWNCYDSNGVRRQQITCPADCDDECFFENQIADQTLRYIEKFKNNYGINNNNNNKSFFIAAGFHRPHLGYFAPLRFYQHYGYLVNETKYNYGFEFTDNKSIDDYNSFKNIPIATNNFIPLRSPKFAYKTGSTLIYYKWKDVKQHLHVEYGISQTLNDNVMINDTGQIWSLLTINNNYHSFIRASYYATVTYMDEQFGRIIDGLKKSGYYNNTIIVFMSDHGFHLGEQSTFTKQTNFEVSARSPLIIRIPGMRKDTYGTKTDTIVEYIDIYPTLVDATIGFHGLNNTMFPLQGKSLLQLIENVDRNEYINCTKNNYHAYSQYRRLVNASDLGYQYKRNKNTNTNKNKNDSQIIEICGLSIRTDDWRYTEWVKFNHGNNNQSAYPEWNKNTSNISLDSNIYAIELYDHSNKDLINDYNSYDTFNLAYNESLQETVNSLHKLLIQTWNISYNYNCTFTHFYNQSQTTTSSSPSSSSISSTQATTRTINKSSKTSSATRTRTITIIIVAVCLAIVIIVGILLQRSKHNTHTIISQIGEKKKKSKKRKYMTLQTQQQRQELDDIHDIDDT